MRRISQRILRRCRLQLKKLISFILLLLLVSTSGSSQTFRFRKHHFLDLNEEFEKAVGLDQVYDDSVIGASNQFNADFDTSLLPGGAPAGWGLQCAHIVIGGEVGAGAYYTKGNALIGSYKGFTTRASIMLISENLENESGNLTFIFAKPLGSVLGSVANWRLFVIQQSPGNLVFLFGVGNDAAFHTWPAAGSLSLGTVYRHIVVYNFVTATYTWTVNGNAAGNGSIDPTWAQTIAWKVHGMSLSSVGIGSEYMLDEINWTEIQ